MSRARSLAFVYLGRSPAFGDFVLELARSVRDLPDISCEFIVADQTELADRLAELGVKVYPVNTFYRTRLHDVVLGFLGARRRILERLANTRPDAVVTLMPHVWSPLLAPQIRRLGIRYATVIHDAVPHPGDPTAWATRWLARDARHADLVVTLSRAVADQLITSRVADASRVRALFHPDLRSPQSIRSRTLDRMRPFRILFFGRIMAYKGLPLLVEAVGMLQKEGMAIELGVAGTGPIDDVRRGLAAVGAHVINQWLPSDEVVALLGQYDAMACSHVEASQSGVAALAFGNAMPVVATPVGGVAEQVVDGEAGVLAREVSARAYAEAMRRLATEPGLYDAISRRLAESHGTRSMESFVSSLATLLGYDCAGARPQ
ncbi:MAG: glycosyltransferase family 4 protein [Hyphomicrobiaceae bacterium]